MFSYAIRRTDGFSVVWGRHRSAQELWRVDEVQVSEPFIFHRKYNTKNIARVGQVASCCELLASGHSSYVSRNIFDFPSLRQPTPKSQQP